MNIEFSELDLCKLALAEPGDLLALDSMVVRIGQVRAGDLDFMIQGCQVFLLCPNDAAIIVDHGVLGLIPACQRCMEVTR